MFDDQYDLPMDELEPAPPIKFDTTLGLRCRECQHMQLAPVRGFIEQFVSGEVSHCATCGEPIDVWRAVLDDIEFGTLGMRYVAIGARGLAFDLTFQRDTPRKIDFTDVGIPSDASIEVVNLTPYGSSEQESLWPLFFRDPRVGHPASEPLLVYPVPFGEGEAVESGQAGAFVIWTPAGPREPADDLLMAAVRASEREDRLTEIVAANAAMEVAVEAAMDAWLLRHGVGGDKRKNFLDNAATYGHQLSVLLPIVCAEVGLPRLPDEPAAALQRLRKVRNEVAHGSQSADAIHDSDRQRGLAAASIGVVLAELLKSRLQAVQVPDA